MSNDDEIERAKRKAVDMMKQHLAKRIVKFSEEGFLPSRLKTCIVVLKIVCAIAVFVCGPILGWLYTEVVRGAIEISMFIIFLLPMLFLAIITAIVLVMKAPE